MILLCVDGVDPDLVNKWGYDQTFKYNYKLTIPQACFVPDVELGSTPHTTRVWPTIFSGRIIDYGLTRRGGLRKKIHDLLVRSGITWKRGKPKYTVNCGNENLDTILNHFDSFAWNIPTISPEWIATFPGYDAFVSFCEREYFMWLLMTQGNEALKGNMDIEAYYLRYIDFVGHNDWKRLQPAYDDIFAHISMLNHVRDDVIVLSDHGCDNGLHTNYAYLGSDQEFFIKGVEEIRGELERILEGNN